MRYLLERVRSRGKSICPIALAWHPGLAFALNIEADLDAWHVAPFAGASQDWPRELLSLLRHIRSLRGLIQMRNMQRDTSKDAEPQVKR